MRELVGQVVSNKMKLTVVVSIERQSRHPLYKKIMRSSKRYKAHCDIEGIAVGDTVKIVETRPISRGKYFKVVGKVTKSG
jgi:small subunit ribosomal protein S17